MVGESLLDVIDLSLKIASAIETNGGTYFVGGSLASSLQGEPRATNDIDFVIELPLGKVEDLKRALGPDFELDSEMLRDALMHARTANAFYLPTVTKIDFFGRGYDGFDDIEFSRRRRVAVKSTGETLQVKSPEDTVLRKLLWFRDGGGVSDKQWRDVISVLRVSGGSLDFDYLARWAANLKIVDLLDRARNDSAQLGA